jgi:transposase InsO family protein
MDPLEAKELFTPVIKKFKKRRIITRGIDELWASDLLNMKKYVNENTFTPGKGKKKKYRYILVVIDTFSKFLFLEKLENKTGKEVTKAFEKILKTSKRKPLLLHTDKGREYLNVTFQKMLNKYGITIYHTFTKEKSAIAERVIRTVNQKLANISLLAGHISGSTFYTNW